MSKSYVPLWAWLDDFQRRANWSGDQERSRLVQMHYRAWEVHEKDPEQALMLCNQGAELARQLDEPCVELFHEYWAAEMLLFYLVRVKEGLDFATKLVTKASTPRYADCPVRARVYITLVSAYYSVDALGYESEIRNMIEFLENDIPLDDDTHHRLQGYRARMWMHVEDYQKAEAETLKYLSMCVGRPYREADGYGVLAATMYYQRRDDKALEYAVLYEEKARRAYIQSSIAGSTLWQALLYRLKGLETEAQQFFLRGMALLSTLGIEKEREYHDMMCRFYEAGKEYEKSLALRDEQLKKLGDVTGQSILFEILRKRCLVLKQMGRLTPADVEAVTAEMNKLKHPDKYLHKLKELESVTLPRY